MIIHIWMHWFWITALSFKAFLLFTVQMISLSCIPNPALAEAGLLVNETLAHSPEETDSSQTPPITLLPLEEGNRQPPETSSQPPFLSSPSEDRAGTELPDGAPPAHPEDIPSSATSDVEDTYNGGSLDVFQFPLKKFTKYSHIKYGKMKMKGRPSEEEAASAGGEERKADTVKVVEEKVNINFSIGSLEPEVDKSNMSITEGNFSEIAMETATSLPLDNSTIDVNETESSAAEEVESVKAEVMVSSTVEASFSEFSSSPPESKAAVLKNDTLVIENKVEEGRAYTTVEPFIVRDRVAAATSAQNYEVAQAGLNAGSITGITLGILVVFSVFGAVSFVLYRRRYLNKPQVLHDKCSNLDSSGYIDDTSFRENSEEMYSLDNDSFLNSLEAMTIQNYWTENVKHTKL